MVPFAEMLNHDCSDSDVYYDFDYKKDNPHIPSDYEVLEISKITEEDEKNFTTCDGTYNSDDP